MGRNPNLKVERSFLRIIGWSLSTIVVLSFSGVVGFRSFRAWQQRRLIAQANAFIAEGDVKRADLNARRILQLNPDNPEAYRLLARVAEKVGSPSAIAWRRRVQDLGAATAEDLISLARDGVRFDDRTTAESTMSRLSAEAKNHADYHALLAEIAYVKRDGVEMERELTEALRLDPANKDYALRLAAVRLNATNVAISAQGRDALLELKKDPALRREATRHLAENAVRRRDFEAAISLGRELDALPDKTFADRLVLLTVLKAADDSGFSKLIAELENAAAQDSDQTASLITWLNANQMSQEAISYADRLPAEIAGGKSVPLAIADSFVAMRDWARLQRLVKTGSWGSLDFFRSVLLARACRELNDEPHAQAEWAEAVRKITGNTPQVLLLLDMVQKWSWRAETTELLWLVAEDPSKGDDALRALYAYFAKNADTQNLYRVLLHQHERHPDDLDVKNNLAQLSLLANLNVNRARELAREVYQKEPRNPAYVSTYAFALYNKGDTDEALDIIETLADEERREPAIAAYYGVILAASEDHARASEYLDLASGAKLLPEETALVERARRAIAPR